MTQGIMRKQAWQWLITSGLLAFAPVSLAEMTITEVGRYQSNLFAQGGAEIVAFDSVNKQVFVVNSGLAQIDVLSLNTIATPQKISTIDAKALGAGANSVAVKNGIVAVAIENVDKQANGLVAFYDSTTLKLLKTVTVGALPDMVTFSPDGKTVLVANEGEPNADYTVDPEGSVSIIDISHGVENAVAKIADFSAFNTQKQRLLNKGVRIFGKGANVAQDLEPEYITVTADSKTAYVSLQEANALAIIDIANAKVLDVVPLGYKDHNQGAPSLQTFNFPEMPDLNTSAMGETVKLGGFSGLHFEGVDSATGNYKFVTIPDRGPDAGLVDVDGDGVQERIFTIPQYQIRVVRFEVNPQTGVVQITQQIPLTRQDGTTPITGLPNIAGADESPAEQVPSNGQFTIEGKQYNKLDYDIFGADLEGIVINPVDNSFWMVDEQRPAIYHFLADGKLANRFVPQGTDPEGQARYGAETLPAVYRKRVNNRGFEAVALDTEQNILYAFIQTPLANPNMAASNASTVIRMLGINPDTGETVAEYVYLLEKPVVRGSVVDKIGDATYAGNGQFYVVERDSDLTANSIKPVYKIDLKGATNLLTSNINLLPDLTLEQHTPDQLSSVGIQAVHKRKILNLPSIGYLPSDKSEGLTVLPDGKLAVLSDNDFAANPETAQIQMGLISFGTNYGLDASDKDGMINIRNWPVLGSYMPDSLANIVINGNTYIVTANEGDSRDYAGFSEEVRIGSSKVVLDPIVFPNASDLKTDEQLGRLKITNTQGDIDGDGDYDELYAFGARSFSVWDNRGNLVYDSGDQFERFTAELLPDFFNTSHDNNKFDDRSDDKGVEPEAIAVGEVNGQPYAFIGFERLGGVAVYNLSNPHAPQFVDYVNNRHFAVTPEAGADTGDLGPEGFSFVHASQSPTGQALLIIGNEISGSTTLYQLGDSATAVTLPNLNTGVATDAQGQHVDKQTSFAGGISVKQTAFDKAVGQKLADKATVRGRIYVDPADVGKVADIVVYAAYKPILAANSPTVPANYFMLNAQNQIVTWDGKLSTLSAYQTNLTLSAQQDVLLYDANWLVSGYLELSFGYRLQDGTLVLSGTPITTTINDTPVVALRTSLIHINDSHSHLTEETIDLNLNGKTTRVNMGGFARVATKINALRKTAENPLVLHIGDAVVGTLYYSLFKGAADAAALNTIKFDALTLGNHEFDDGNANLAQFLKQLDNIPALSANIDVSQSADLKDLVKPYLIKEINGQKVALVGITTLKTLVSSSPGADITFSNEVEAAKQVVAELEGMGINKIIFMTHYGYTQDIELAKQVSGIDVILGGDSHTLLGNFSNIGLSSEGAYPTIARTPAGEKVCIGQAWQYAYVVGFMTVDFDDAGNVLYCDGNPTLLLGDNFLQADAAGTFVAVSDAMKTQLSQLINTQYTAEIVPENSDMAGVLSLFSEQVNVLKQSVIGKATDSLLHIRIPGKHTSGVELSHGSMIAPVVAEGFYQQLKTRNYNPDLILQNAGGVRVDLPQGDITVATAYTLLPFGNTIYVLDMTGAEVKQAIEDGLSNYFDNAGSSGSFPYAYGIHYTVDMNKANGERVTSLEVMSKTDGTYSVINPESLYRVGVNSFMATGGDGYTTLKKVAADRRTDTYFDYAESFVNYMKAVGTISAPTSYNLTYIPKQ
ncbi:NAD nucleotidase [Beggiatoa leptomitoformis]|uniref:NAD nucleotidase n=1 Tax=Beggiatoa leptomitoformis TaxID=288004 RepID=A0A2N9YAW7_9GAMM|nr:NAD nucleotidase [Beggiatoa leptomitoformis]AUI67584.1 NAD nucleotidase [Beggiatoa leptomitoformis]QGX03530.1 NAD nucleotidase [Beggiatoa leptomitoformis]